MVPPPCTLNIHWRCSFQKWNDSIFVYNHPILIQSKFNNIIFGTNFERTSNAHRATNPSHQQSMALRLDLLGLSSSSRASSRYYTLHCCSHESISGPVSKLHHSCVTRTNCLQPRLTHYRHTLTLSPAGWRWRAAVGFPFLQLTDDSREFGRFCVTLSVRPHVRA